MKYIIALLLVASVLFSAPPSRTAVDGYYEWQIDSIINAGTLDTIAASDSSTLHTGYHFEPGWEYILTRNAFTGTGADSTSCYLRMDLYDLDTSSSVTYTVNVDTFTASAGEAVLIPVGQSAFCNKAQLKIISYSDGGSQLILNRFVMWKRRILTRMKRW